MVTVHIPSAPRAISYARPNRTCTFWASGAARRNATRLSEYTQGYCAPGIFSVDGLQPSAACPQHSPQLNTASTNVVFTGTPSTPKRVVHRERLQYTGKRSVRQP